MAESVVYDSVWLVWMKCVRLGDQVFLCAHVKQQHCTHHVPVSLFLSTQCLKPPNKRNSPWITTDSVWHTLMRMKQRSLDRRFFRETASLVMVKQYILCLLRVFPNNTCRGISNGRGDVVYANVRAPLTSHKTAKLFYNFFLLCVHCSYQYKRNMA